MRSSTALRLTGLALALFASVEVAIRLSGIVDVPVYLVDERLGYLPRPSQAGSFLRRNSWYFNAKSMATEDAWSPAGHGNVMLIGNSVVMGGNAYDQKDKLEPLLAREIGAVGTPYVVWPVAAGGWTNVNEIEYLSENPDVVAATDFFVWEYMSGGLHTLSRWRGEYVFPSKRPLLASWYVLRRYVLPRFMGFDMNELPPQGSLEANNAQRFAEYVGKLAAAAGGANPGIVFLYPVKAELLAARRGEEWLPERATLAALCERYGLKLLDVAQSPDWTADLYRDGTHPTERGNRVLAHILAGSIRDSLAARAHAVAARGTPPPGRTRAADRTPAPGASGG